MVIAHVELTAWQNTRKKLAADDRPSGVFRRDDVAPLPVVEKGFQANFRIGGVADRAKHLSVKLEFQNSGASARDWGWAACARGSFRRSDGRYASDAAGNALTAIPEHLLDRHPDTTLRHAPFILIGGTVLDNECRAVDP